MRRIRLQPSELIGCAGLAFAIVAATCGFLQDGGPAVVCLAIGICAAVVLFRVGDTLDQPRSPHEEQAVRRARRAHRRARANDRLRHRY